LRAASGKLAADILPLADRAVPDPAASALKRERLGYRQKNQPGCAIDTAFVVGGSRATD